MIVDSSALVAVLRAEPEAEAMLRVIDCSDCCVSAVSFVEAAVVIDRSGDPVASRRLDELLRETEISIEPVTVEQAKIAREAYRDFGKGRHRARLNLGDCFAYALAKERGEPLLFKGKDFCYTDVEPALTDS